MAALVAARTAIFLKEGLWADILPIHFWADSCIVLNWIEGSASRWKPFVCDRVTEIRSFCDPDDWRHCPGKENPADCLTRGMTVRTLRDGAVWWHGPDWLGEGHERWTGTEAPLDPLDTQAPLLKLENFSRYLKLIRAMAWIICFVTKCRKGTREASPWLSANEITTAETFCVKRAQRDSYGSEVDPLASGADVPATCKIAGLQPFLDGAGIVRLKDRLHYMKEEQDVKHPIILENDHHPAYMIAEAARCRTLHGGAQATLSELRERWWVARARQLAKRITFKCQVCLRFRPEPATARTSPLPSDRTHRRHPFQVVGIDFAGSLFVEPKDGSRKSYTALLS